MFRVVFSFLNCSPESVQADACQGLSPSPGILGKLLAVSREQFMAPEWAGLKQGMRKLEGEPKAPSLLPSEGWGMSCTNLKLASFQSPSGPGDIWISGGFRLSMNWNTLSRSLKSRNINKHRKWLCPGLWQLYEKGKQGRWQRVWERSQGTVALTKDTSSRAQGKREASQK